MSNRYRAYPGERTNLARYYRVGQSCLGRKETSDSSGQTDIPTTEQAGRGGNVKMLVLMQVNHRSAKIHSTNRIAQALRISTKCPRNQMDHDRYQSLVRLRRLRIFQYNFQD